MTAEMILSSPGLVNPVLTEEQAVYTHQALIELLNTPVGDLSGDPDQERYDRAQLADLVQFFAAVVDNPEAFGVRTQIEAKQLIRAAKPNKGEAKLSSRRHGRKRQTGRGQRKKNSLATKVSAAKYNAARDKMEADRVEMEQAHNDEMKKRIDRSNELLTKDELSIEEVQELLGIMGYENVAEASRLMRAENDPKRRIEAAVDRARAENPED